MTRAITLTPGRATLADWRAVCRRRRAARSRRHAGDRGERARGRRPSWRGASRSTASIPASESSPACASPPHDLATLQRNIVLSHAAGVGEPMRPAIVRLMMALKLASLGRGASGVRPDTVGMLEAHAGARRDPGGAGQGSVGASGDLAPLAHMAAAMLGVGEAVARQANACRPRPRSRAPGSRRSRSGRRKASRCSTARSSRPRRRSRACSRSSACSGAALVTGALSTDAAKGSDTPFDAAHPGAARPSRPDRGGRGAARADGGQRDPRSRISSNDDRVQDPYCLRCQPQVMGAVLDLLRQAAATLATEANGVSDNPLIFADDRRGAVRRQLPRRAGRVRRRHAGDRGLRDRLARRAAHRHAGRSRAVRPAGVPHAAARAQFRLHDARR